MQPHARVPWSEGVMATPVRALHSTSPFFAIALSSYGPTKRR
jgi:hypothetical protein